MFGLINECLSRNIHIYIGLEQQHAMALIHSFIHPSQPASLAIPPHALLAPLPTAHLHSVAKKGHM